MEGLVPNFLSTITQDQLILARSKLWTPELDKLIRKWKNQVGKRERGHLNQNRKFTRRHYVLGGPAIILSTIVSVGIFATFRNCDECDDQGAPECAIDQWIRLVSGIICLISMALTAFLTFMNYADTAADHKTAADDFGSMFRSLDTMLLVPPPVRGDPQATLQNIRNQYDDLVRRSPTLPSKYDAVLSFEVVGKSRLPKPPTPEQVPLSNIQPPSVSPNTTTDLRKLLSGENKNSDKNDNSGSPSTYSTMDKISHFMAQENDYDTEEEDQEVKLAFDLDDNTNYNATAAAFAAAELASRKEQLTQNSLQAALAFEIQRLDGNTFFQTKLARESKKKNKQKISPRKRTQPRSSSDENILSSSPKEEEKSDIEVQIDNE